MSPTAISVIVFLCVFAGAMLGMFLRSVLPENHLNADSKDVVKAGLGLVATMAALVLALLIASAKSSHDTQSAEVVQLSADFIQLDRLLAHYGPETKDARAQLRAMLARGIGQTWASGRYESAKLDSAEIRASTDSFLEKIQQLAPVNDLQRSFRDQAMQVMADAARTRALLLEQTGGSIPMPFLVVLIFWLVIIFVGFGLFAPANPTVMSVLLVCALSAAGAIFLIVELDRPLEGLIHISDAPLRNALEHIGH
jgi:Protein of unknown function (DUF4239)